MRNRGKAKKRVPRRRNPSVRRGGGKHRSFEQAPKISNVPSIESLLKTWLETFIFTLVSVLTLLVTTFWLCFRIMRAPIEIFCSSGRKRKTNASSVLITGGSAGLGKGLAFIYAKRGARIVLVARRLDQLVAVQKQCYALGAKKVDVSVCDVRDADEMSKVVLEADTEQPLDLVIANAGVLSDTDGLHGSKRVLDINLRGSLNTVWPILERFAARKTGQVLFMSSLGAYAPATNAFMMPYLASKAAINQFGGGLRTVMKKYNVGVSVACLGMVESELTMKQLQGQYKAELMGLMTQERGCQLIVEGVDENVGVITFPLWLYVVSRALGSLNSVLSDGISPYLQDGDPFGKIDNVHPIFKQ